MIRSLYKLIRTSLKKLRAEVRRIFLVRISQQLRMRCTFLKNHQNKPVLQLIKDHTHVVITIGQTRNEK